MSSRAGARTGLLLFELACVTIVLALAISGAATQAYHGKTMLAGLVLPEGCLPDRTCTASLVTNPDEIAGTPGLLVRRVRVPEHKDSHGHATLEGEVISSVQGEHQLANGPFTFTVPQTGAGAAIGLEVALADAPGETVVVPIPQLPPSHENSNEKRPTMAPVVPDNGVCLVHDNFTGDGRATRIKVNGADVPALAESPSVLAFAPRAALQTGENRIVVADGGSTKTYRAWNPGVTIDADKTVLEQNESTHFRVKLNMGLMPETYWGGPNQTQAGLAQGQSGVLLLTIKNDSQATATIGGGDVITVPLHESDLSGGTYTYEGTITAKEPGSFQIEAATESHLADAPPIVSEEHKVEATPTPMRTHKRTPVAKETPAAPRAEYTPEETAEETPATRLELGPPVVSVPGVPPLVVPKCCVITSITITNTENVRVFYLINQKYQPGMNPPNDQWVKPGESRTFKGDFGRCVQIHAFQNQRLDSEGHLQTGVFDLDHTKLCCEDLLSGRAKAKRFTFVIGKLEWREWKDCPENRTPSSTPTKTSTPTATRTATKTPTETATETETPTRTATSTPTWSVTRTPSETPTPVVIAPPPPEPADCPQRGLKCAALIVDFSENTHWFEASFESLEKPLEELHCDVDSAYPEFWVYNQWIVVGVGGHNLTYETNAEQKAKAQEHNLKEWKKVDGAIALHRMKLAGGREIALEFVKAHGGPGAPGENGISGRPDRLCGQWETDFQTTQPWRDLKRSDFIKDNYRSAQHKLCDWFTYDASCYSGQTPWAVDELENRGYAACLTRSIVNCPLHAGYEADLAGSVDKATSTSMNGRVFTNAVQLTNLLDGLVLHQAVGKFDYQKLAKALRNWLTGKGLAGFAQGGASASYYTDDGYHGDRPPPEAHKHTDTY